MADPGDGDMSTARYIMIGGFLGAGKSTSVGRLAHRLSDRGLRVGLITNDQGNGLVDTRSLRRQGFSVEEIAGGCFCCRFDSLRSAASRLDAASRPDVFLAEPVGSCTDLVATVSYPLRRMYGDQFTIAPLSVVIDPVRAGRILGIRDGRQFSSKVTYVYLKQLEEADLLVINKIDQLAKEEREQLARVLAERYPGKQILQVSAREGIGLDTWFDTLIHDEASERPTMHVDYRLYGEGEALLGWLNATFRFESRQDLDGNGWLSELAFCLQRRLLAAGAEVAHLKMTLAPEGGFNDLALVNLVNLDFVPEISERLFDPVSSGQLVINLRAEAAPEVLRKCLLDEILERRAGEVVLRQEHLECFRPGQPVPVHRVRIETDPTAKTLELV